MVLLSVSVGAVKGDCVKYNEVSRGGVRTGHSLVGIIEFIDGSGVLFNNGSSILVYCSSVSEPLGSASIGRSLIIG